MVGRLPPVLRGRKARREEGVGRRATLAVNTTRSLVSDILGSSFILHISFFSHVEFSIHVGEEVLFLF